MSAKKNRKSPRAQKAPKGAADSSPIGRRVVWLIGITAWVFIALAAVSFDPADPPSHLVSPLNDPVENLCGPVSALATERWCRPLTFQYAPEQSLPPELRGENPLGIERMVNGVGTRARV